MGDLVFIPCVDSGLSYLLKVTPLHIFEIGKTKRKAFVFKRQFWVTGRMKKKFVKERFICTDWLTGLKICGSSSIEAALAGAGLLFLKTNFDVNKVFEDGEAWVLEHGFTMPVNSI